MTRPQAEYDEAMRLVALGLNDCEIERRTGINRRTVLDWRHGGCCTKSERSRSDCPLCDRVGLDRFWYAHLLGLYLGDGMITAMPRDVFKLRIVLDLKYINIIDECAEAMRRVRPASDFKIGFVHKPGCVEVTSHWKHWPCLFPQHGSGRKHERTIALEPWQEWIVLQHPRRLLRGLVQSDGCRDANVVKGKSYPRYSFCNKSEDIKQIFCNACDLLGIHWTRPNRMLIAISRRKDVATLDRFIGPKR